MRRPDETEQKIILALEWLEARLRDVDNQWRGLYQVLAFGYTDSPHADRHLLSELRRQRDQFETLIAQHKERLRKYRRERRVSKPEQHESSPEPLIYAVPRLDVFPVIEVERVPIFAEHSLATQIATRAQSLENWNYRCLGTRHRRPSRRYEGFNDAR